MSFAQVEHEISKYISMFPVSFLPRRVSRNCPTVQGKKLHKVLPPHTTSLSWGIWKITLWLPFVISGDSEAAPRYVFIQFYLISKSEVDAFTYKSPFPWYIYIRKTYVPGYFYSCHLVEDVNKEQALRNIICCWENKLWRYFQNFFSYYIYIYIYISFL